MNDCAAHIVIVKSILTCILAFLVAMCKFIGTKENVSIRKDFNSFMTGLEHQHGHLFIAPGHQYGCGGPI